MRQRKEIQKLLRKTGVSREGMGVVGFAKNLHYRSGAVFFARRNEFFAADDSIV